MNALASAFAARLPSSANYLVVLVDGTWIRHPWPEVHARSENIADRLLNDEVDVAQRVASECGVVPSDVIRVRPGALPRTSSGKLRLLEVKRDLGNHA